MAPSGGLFASYAVVADQVAQNNSMANITSGDWRETRLQTEVFDPDDILPKGLIVRSNWRQGRVGEWVKADDDCVLEVLRQGTMKRQKGKNREVAYVGTCTGTFPAYSHTKMDSSRRINIYSFGGGKLADDVLIERINLSKCEQVFVVYLAS